MFARIIPAIRAPRRLAGFDYAVPEGLTVAVGDLVYVPFRTKTLVGVVVSLSEALEEPARVVKPLIGLVGGLQLSTRTVQLLQALATRSLSSPASVLHAWIGTLPKKIGEGPVVKQQSAMLAGRDVRLLADRWHTNDGVIETALRVKKEGKRVLILTPWTESAASLADRLSAPALTSDLAAGGRYKAWSGFLRGDHPILIATRVGAWLSTEADLVILDEPENDDHKQDEMAPRYDARWIVTQAHDLGSDVIEIGLTPRLEPTSMAAPMITPIVHAIDINRADWSAVAGIQGRTLLLIEAARAEGRAVTIIHPIHGDRARLRCQDCGWTAACARCGAGPSLEAGHLACHRCGWKSDAILDCPSCGGARLSRSRPGRETTMRDLTTQNLEGVRVVSLGEWNATKKTGDQKNGLVVLTDLSLLAGGVEDTRRRERLIIAYRRLADICASSGSELAVQSDAQLLADAASWLGSEGCDAALEKECAERLTFHLPPAARLIKFVVRGFASDAHAFMNRLRLAVIGGSIQGPFAVERLPGSRMPRSIVQLILPLETPEKTIYSLLEPILSDNVLVDLDPVAFFE